MAQQTVEFFAVFIGGQFSLQIRTFTMTASSACISAVHRVNAESRYVCGELIRLPCPERLVAVYGYADACNSVRTETFRVVAVMSHLVKSHGDVDVAMGRLKDEQNLDQWNVPRDAQNLSSELYETVARQYHASSLCKRLATASTHTLKD